MGVTMNTSIPHAGGPGAIFPDYNEALTQNEALLFSSLEKIGDTTKSCPSLYLQPKEVNGSNGYLTNVTRLETSITEAYPNQTSTERLRIQAVAVDIYFQSVGWCEELNNPGPDSISRHKPKIDHTYKFLPQLEQLEDIHTPPQLSKESLATENVKALIVEFASGVRHRVEEGTRFYTPYLFNDEQIEATSYYANLAKTIETEIDSLIWKRPRAMVFAQSEFNRVKLLPTSIPGSDQPGDVESGYCDKLNNSNLPKGEIAWGVASYKDEWVYVIGHNVRGWVQIDPTDGNNYHQGRQYHLACFQNSITSPAEFINHVWKPQPYAHAINDCSALAKRALLATGFRVSGFSGDLFDDLENVGLPSSTFASAGELNTLYGNGIYLVQLLSPSKTEGVYNSAHLYVATIDETGELKAVSLVFNTKDGDGNMVFPIGSNISTKAEFEGQLNRGRKLKFVKIAAQQ